MRIRSMINAETDGELVKNDVMYEYTLKKHLNNINKEIIEASTNGKNSINYTVCENFHLIPLLNDLIGILCIDKNYHVSCFDTSEKSETLIISW